MLALAQHLAGEWIEFEDALDLVAEELQPGRDLLVSRLDVDGIAARAKSGAPKVGVVPLVHQLDQLALQDVAADRVALLQFQGLAKPVLRGADAVDAGDAGHDDHVAPGEQGAHGAGAKAVDLVVAGGVLLDVGVSARDVSLGLVVVVVADEILDRVVGKELAKFRAELRRQRLVGRDHQRRPLYARDDVGDGEGLAAAGDAHQRLLALSLLEPAHELVDGLRLIAGGRKG